MIRINKLTNLVRLELAWHESRRLDHMTPLVKTKVPAAPMKAPLAKQPISPRVTRSAEKHAKSFGPQHHAAIKRYKDGDVGAAFDDKAEQPINDSLRKKRKLNPKDAAYAENLKHVTSHVMPSEQITYRGGAIKSAFPVGHKFTDHGFTSSTVDPEIADDFLDEGEGRKYVIHSPKGTKMYHVDRHFLNQPRGKGFYDNYKQGEFMHHPDTHYETLGHERRDSESYKAIRKNYPGEGEPDEVTHLAVIGQGYKKGKPDTSLTSHPEGKRWLANKRKNWDKM